MSDLIRQAQERSGGEENAKATLEAWEKVLKYVKSNGSAVIFSEFRIGNGRPHFRGDWAKLNAWCKLIGLKPVWVGGPGTGGGVKMGNGPWEWPWDLELQRQSLPSESLKKRLIEEFGSPPGY